MLPLPVCVSVPLGSAMDLFAGLQEHAHHLERWVALLLTPATAFQTQRCSDAHVAGNSFALQ